MKLNFGKVFNFLPLIGYIVAGIEQIHADAPGETKKQIAQEALGLAVGTAENALPGDAPMVAAAGAATSALIDGSVSLFNALGLFTHKAAQAATAS